MYKFSKMVRPALYEGPLGWRWVKLSDLAHMLNVPEQDVVLRYIRLSKDSPYLTLSIEGEDYVLNYSIEKIVRKISMGYRLMVPAGWATAILDRIQGESARRLAHRIEWEINRVSHEVWEKGYIVYDGIEPEKITEAVKNAISVNVEGEQILFYDEKRFEMAAVEHGSQYFESISELGDGWFLVASDEPMRDGSCAYFLRELKRGK